MNREFVKTTIPGITDEQLNSIMTEYGKAVNAGNQAIETLKARDTEIAGLKEQITQRDKDIKDLQDKAKGNDDLTKQLNDLKAKYETDTEALQKKLNDQAVDHAVESFFAEVPFASTLAKKAAIADFKSKGYEFKDGKFVGSEGYLAQLEKDDPAAFKPKDNDKPDDNGADNSGNQPSRPPKFTTGTGTGNGGNGKTNPFNFHFTAVRATPTDKN